MTFFRRRLFNTPNWIVYRRLLSLMKPYRKGFWWGVVGFFIYAQTQWFWAQLLDYIFSSIQAHSSKISWKLPLIITAIFIIRGIGSFLGTYGIAFVSRNVVRDLRQQLFNHLLKLDTYFYHKHSSGQILSRLIYDVEQVSGASSDALKIVLQEGLTVIGLFSYLIYKNWQLSLLFILITPAIGLVVGKASKRLGLLSSRIQNAMADVTHVTKEAVNAQRTVKAFGGQAYEQARFAQANNNNLKQGLKLVITAAVSTPIVQLLVAICLAVLVWIALQPAFLGHSTAGDFIAYITAAGLMAKPIRELTQVNTLIQRGIVGAASAFQLMDLPVEIDQGTQTLNKVRGHLVFQNISFRYPEKDTWALQNINGVIEPGQTIALVGKSGGGKSTLASLVPRFYDPTEGDILLDDISLKNIALTNLRKHIAFVSQQIDLFDDTIENNIAYGNPDATPEDIHHAAELANALEFIEKLPQGMATQIGEIGVLLSGGQRQRIAIARALLKKAPILILDEATSALDNESENLIQQALLRVMQHCTTLVIAHRLSTVESADCIWVIDQGCIVERGTHQQLIQQKGLYHQLHSIMLKSE